MSKMLHRNFKKNVCSCIDCGGDGTKGRALEKREWKEEANNEVANFLEPEPNLNS